MSYARILGTDSEWNLSPSGSDALALCYLHSPWADIYIHLLRNDMIIAESADKQKLQFAKSTSTKIPPQSTKFVQKTHRNQQD